MNDYNNQIGKIMKLKELMDIESVIAKHTDKLKMLSDMDIDKLSISELAFIKIVSSGSITAMKKHGASNQRILMTEKSATLSDGAKVKMFLKSLTSEKLAELLAELNQ